jgi:predicted nucleotidyltransferase
MSKRIDWRRVSQVFEGYSNVIAAWAFGSTQRGEVLKGSDVDIAVLFQTIPSLDELASLRAELQAHLQFDDIDLLVLNGASPITRFEAVTGRSIFCRDVGERAEFVSLTAREYEDTIAFIQLGLENYSPA